MPYLAPETAAIIIGVGTLICASTGEKFGNLQNYSDDWEEED